PGEDVDADLLLDGAGAAHVVEVVAVALDLAYPRPGPGGGRRGRSARGCHKGKRKACNHRDGENDAGSPAGSGCRRCRCSVTHAMHLLESFVPTFSLSGTAHPAQPYTGRANDDAPRGAGRCDFGGERYPAPTTPRRPRRAGPAAIRCRRAAGALSSRRESAAAIIARWS